MNRRSFAIALLMPAQLAMLARGFTAHDTSAAPRRDLAGKLAPCHVADVDEEVLCGRYQVYEDRAARVGRRISLNVVVLPAKMPEVAPDPLVFLAGGGVAPATGYAGYLASAFADLRAHRDIVLIDQRGTGSSNPLHCELSTDPASAEYRDEARFLAAVRGCREALRSKADLRFYTTPLAMDDLDEVRQWLGYPRLNLYGVSYGTQAAMVYLRQHPERVRTVVLHGVVPLDVPMWLLEVPRSAQQVLDRVFAACAEQKACRDAFPNLPHEFDALLERLTRKPVKVEVTRREGRQEVEVPIDAEIVRDFVARTLYSAARIHDLPVLIHLAHAGDYRPLALRLASRGESGIPKGVYLSIVCSEEMQFDAAALSSAAAGTFMGELRIGRDILACGEWPRGWLPEGYWTPVQSGVPSLILNGSLDFVTPPRYGEKVSRSLAKARRLVLPGRGHNDTDPCVAGLVQAFVTTGDPDHLPTSCLENTGDLTFTLTAEKLVN